MTGCTIKYVLSACGLLLETLKVALTCFCHWLIGCCTSRLMRFYTQLCCLSLCTTESSVLQSPVFTKQPGSIVYPVEILERNREVVFSCEAQGSPPPIYRWVCKGSRALPHIIPSHQSTAPTLTVFTFRQTIAVSILFKTIPPRVGSSANKSKQLQRSSVTLQRDVACLCYFRISP